MCNVREHAPSVDCMRHTHHDLLHVFLIACVLDQNAPAAAGDGIADPPTQDWDTSDVSESLQRPYFSRRGPGLQRKSTFPHVGNKREDRPHAKR